MDQENNGMNDTPFDLPCLTLGCHHGLGHHADDVDEETWTWPCKVQGCKCEDFS